MSIFNQSQIDTTSINIDGYFHPEFLWLTAEHQRQHKTECICYMLVNIIVAGHKTKSTSTYIFVLYYHYSMLCFNYILFGNGSLKGANTRNRQIVHIHIQNSV